MKVGDYVRTKNGEIFKKPLYSTNDIIVKSSPNIIDLIEVGDYVNGSKVVDIAQAPKKAIYTESNSAPLIPITNENISSILTKEQFKNWEYRIGE